MTESFDRERTRERGRPASHIERSATRSEESRRALAEWESLFEHPRAAAEPETEREAVEMSATEPTQDRPASAFHVYDWVLRKLRARPSTTYADLSALAARGRFSVSEGHYKRARQQVAGESSRSTSTAIETILADTLQLIRAPLADLRQLREVVDEIASICDDALAGTSES